MEEIYALLAGTLYGLLVGLIPSAGATTGLVALFGFISYFGYVGCWLNPKQWWGTSLGCLFLLFRYLVLRAIKRNQKESKEIVSSR